MQCRIALRATTYRAMRTTRRAAVKAGAISDFNAQGLIDRLDARLSGSDDAIFSVDNVQPMENGGMVALVGDITEQKA